MPRQRKNRKQGESDGGRERERGREGGWDEAMKLRLLSGGLKEEARKCQ